MDAIVLVGSLFALGYLAQKLRLFPDETPLILNRFVITLALPALILGQIPTLGFSWQMFVPPFVAWVVMGVSAVAVVLVSRAWKFTREVEGALMLVAVLTNSSFVGIPMITAYLGEASLAHLMMYDQLGTALALSTYGAWVVARYAHQGTMRYKAIAQKIVTFPPFIALLFGFVLMATGTPAWLHGTFTALAATIIPLALFSAGLQLRLTVPKASLAPFGAALGIKLILAPLTAWMVCVAFDWTGMAAHVSIMEAGMAPMITAGVLASASGLAPRLATSIVGYGILFSFGTSALVYMLIGLHG